MKPSELTRKEVEKCLAECNFTKDEELLFVYSSKGNTQEESAELMNVSISTIKRIYRRIKSKMARI